MTRHEEEAIMRGSKKSQLFAMAVLALAVVGMEAHANSDPDSPVVEVEALFIAFARADIDVALKHSDGRLDVSSLDGLWKAGKGVFLTSPKLRTLSGQGATVKAVREFVYPTQFNVRQLVPGGTNAAGAVGAFIEPGGFETREAGVVFSAWVEVLEDGRTIKLTVSSEFVAPPEWKKVPVPYAFSSGHEGTAHVEQPVFHSQAVSTSVETQSGQTFLAGGGMASAGGDKIVYVFVTATMLDGPAVEQ